MTMKGHWREFFSCVCMWQINTRILVLFGHIHIVMDKCISYLLGDNHIGYVKKQNSATKKLMNLLIFSYFIRSLF